MGGDLDPDRLVFIDETWLKTNMAPLRGWPAGRYQDEYELIRMDSSKAGIRARAIIRIGKAHNTP